MTLEQCREHLYIVPLDSHKMESTSGSSVFHFYLLLTELKIQFGVEIFSFPNGKSKYLLVPNFTYFRHQVDCSMFARTE